LVLISRVPDVYNDIDRFAYEEDVSNRIVGCTGVQPVIVSIELDPEVQRGLILCSDRVS